MNANPTISDPWRSVWSVSKPGKIAAERHFAILALGLVQALREGRMTVDEAWDSGLNFKTYMGLKERHADQKLLKLWLWAMELPQVAKLGNDALRESYDHMEILAYAVVARTPLRRNPSYSHPDRRSDKKGRRITREEIRAAIVSGRR